MKKQFNILLATDYSESVMNAERYAVQFAKKTNSVLTFLHVYKIPLSLSSEVSEYIKETSDLRKHELQRLEQHVEQILRSLDIKPGEINFECVVLEGNIGKQIRKEAERSHMDMVITGAHEANVFHKLLFGSHTWDVIKRSKVPVLAIPEDACLSEIKNIVFATEYREGEISGILFLAELAKQFDAELTVLHITNRTLSREFELYIFEKFRAEVQSKTAYDKLNLRLMHYDNIVEGLDNYCKVAKTDWLVMSHDKPFFLESIFAPEKSVTKEMSFHTHVPLLTIPDFYKDENFYDELKKEKLFSGNKN